MIEGAEFSTAPAPAGNNTAPAGNDIAPAGKELDPGRETPAPTKGETQHLELQAQHEALNARFGEFGGWRMPLHYSSPLREHEQVRNAAGVFDISHMGRFFVYGAKSEAFLEHLLTNRVAGLADGTAVYSPICREDGGVLDDVIVYRMHAEHYRVIVNASRRAEDLAWMRTQAQRFEVRVEDRSVEECLFAVQGPRSLEALAAHCTDDPRRMPYYACGTTRIAGRTVFLARTGYTGEPGCELAVACADAPALWELLTQRLKFSPIGLVARDTLRLEAALPLYGHELHETWHPLECGLGWAVREQEKEAFLGRERIVAQRAQRTHERLIGLRILGRGIAREGYTVHAQGAPVGVVTSGTMSPTLGYAIALAKLRRAAARMDTRLSVAVRGRMVEAVVVRRPFYQNAALREVR